ncbi:MAG: endonuclease/exonuclease/phosphatase family protein [Tannerella sp.]|jgi:endonuclease/exonuclease/phosphatase family metal-dependent hydrolase|nr:endonuclease/exonuclease/phosphatase family protein [Tannerella sp.]
MKHLITLLFFSTTRCAQEASVRLKILSYNLRFGELASLEQLANFIKEQNPDVVALQEVDCRTFRDRAPLQHDKDFVTELGFRTGMLTAYGKTIPYAGGYYGIGILSKYPLAKVERIYLPKTKENGKEQRAVLVAQVEYKDDRYFTFACTHLDYTNTEERQLQVAKLNEVLLDKSPVIVAGDFNARPDSKEIAEGMNAWTNVSDNAPTAPANAPRNKIDYIFCYPADRWTVEKATTYNVPFSDHQPISAVLLLKNVQ